MVEYLDSVKENIRKIDKDMNKVGWALDCMAWRIRKDVDVESRKRACIGLRSK